MLSRFVASVQQQQPVNDEASLAKGSAANPAELPGLASRDSPCRAASMLPSRQAVLAWWMCRPRYLLFFSGGRAIHYTYKDMQRKKPQVSNGRPSTAEAASYPHYLGRGRHKSLQRGNMSGKTSSPQGSCPPAHSQACSFSTNKASPLSESTQHSCQDHKYNEVPSKASSIQDSCSPSICQARFVSLDKRQAHA